MLMPMVFFKSEPMFKPGISGSDGSVCGTSPSNLNVSVALSPSVSVSRSSDAVNEAAHAAPGSSTASSIVNVFKVNRIFVASILTDAGGKCSPFFCRMKVQNHLPPAGGKRIMLG